MFDNIRRSLSAPAVVLALIAALATPAEDAAIWIGFILATIVLPPLLPLLSGLAPHRRGVTWRSHLRALRAELRLALVQSSLMLVFLAHQAWLMTDAIVRTLVRLYVTRRRLLEWVAAEQAALGPRPGVARFYQRMAGALVLGVMTVAVAWTWGRGTWPMATAFATLWFASPAVAFWASQSPRTASRRPLDKADAQSLRLIARRTWRFFETFVTPADHMLPPDNFQEVPEPVLARRTSPTNIGLYLLSTASARDLGWIGTLDAVDRLEATLSTMAGLARCRGHFYNWYDTADLRPLDPRYVSSVDSGNLAGHLIALANGCREWRSHVLAEPRRLAGVTDALELALEEARRLSKVRPLQSVTWRRLEDELARLASSLEQAEVAAGGAELRLADLSGQAAILMDAAREIAIETGDQTGADLQFWAEAVHGCIESHRRDLDAPSGSASGARLEALERLARSMAMSMEFDFLLDPDRLLLSIGYQVSDGALDPSCYDLLASEARLASFVAIAKGDAPARHWFRLSHTVTPAANGAALIRIARGHSPLNLGRRQQEALRSLLGWIEHWREDVKCGLAPTAGSLDKAEQALRAALASEGGDQ
jgi:cyclic beta-1,2-glucan synthetase